jgi:hypothetical protein
MKERKMNMLEKYNYVKNRRMKWNILCIISLMDSRICVFISALVIGESCTRYMVGYFLFLNNHHFLLYVIEAFGVLKW